MGIHTLEQLIHAYIQQMSNEHVLYPRQDAGCGGGAQQRMRDQILALAKMIFKQREPAISHQHIKRYANCVSCHKAHKLGSDMRNNTGTFL